MFSQISSSPFSGTPTSQLTLFEVLFPSLYSNFAPVLFLLVLTLALLVPVLVLKCLAFMESENPAIAAFIPVYSDYVLAKVAFGEKYAWVGIVTGILLFGPLAPLAVIAGRLIFFHFCLSFDIHPILVCLGVIFPIIPLCAIAFCDSVVYEGPDKNNLSKRFS